MTGARTAPPRRRSLRALALAAAAASRAVTTRSRSPGRPERMWAVRPWVTPTDRRPEPGTRSSTESSSWRVTPRTESMGVDSPTVPRSRRRVARAAAAPMRRARAWTSTTASRGPRSASSRATPRTPWEWPTAPAGGVADRDTPAAGRASRTACWARRIPGTDTSAVSAAPRRRPTTGAAWSVSRRAPVGVTVSSSAATGARRSATAASRSAREAARSRSRATRSARTARQGVAWPPKATM